MEELATRVGMALARPSLGYSTSMRTVNWESYDFAFGHGNVKCGTSP